MSFPTMPRVRAVLACAALALAVACGDRSTGPQTPEARVVAVALSPDTLWLDVGDTAIARAEPRDRNGNAVTGVSPSWTASAGLSVDASGRVTALAGGSGTVRAAVGARVGELPVVVRAPITSTTLTSASDTLDAIGAKAFVGVTATSGTTPRVGRYTATALDTGIVWISWEASDPSNPVLSVTGLRTGEARVEVRERQGSADTVRVVVQPRFASVTLCRCEIAALVGRNVQLVATGHDRLGGTTTNAPLEWISRDDAVARVVAGLLEPRAVGRTVVLARDPVSGAQDSVFVTVGPAPGVRFSWDTLEVYALARSTIFTVNVGDDAAAAAGLTITVADTSVARLDVQPQYFGAVLSATGEREGVTRVVARAPGLRPDTMYIRVVPTRVVVRSGSLRIDGEVAATVGRDDRVEFGLIDRFGSQLVVGRDRTFDVRSTDTAVVAVDPRATLLAGEGHVSLVQLDVRRAGRAWVVVSGNDVAPDSVLVNVTGQPRLRFGPRRVTHAAVGFRWPQYEPGLYLGTSLGWDKDTVPVTLEHRGTAAADVPASLRIPSNQLSVTVPIAGAHFGVDTVIASAPGYEGDTAVIVVGSPRIVNLGGESYSMRLGAYGTLAFNVADSSGRSLQPLEPRTFTLTSSDARVATAPPSVTIASGTWTTTYATFTPVDTGTTTLTIADPQGVVASRSVQVRAVLDTTLGFTFNYSFAPVGTGQRYDGRAFYVHVPEGTRPLWVHLRSTDPAVLTVEDSVLMREYPNASHESPLVFTGTRPGTASIVLSARGFRDYVTAPITVGRSRLRLAVPDSILARGRGHSVRVESRMPSHELYGNVAMDVPLALEAVDGGLTLPSAGLRIAQGEVQTGPIDIAAPAAGTFRIVARDAGGAGLTHSPDTASVRVVLPSLGFVDPVMTLPLGVRATLALIRPTALAHEATPVSVTRRGTRVDVRSSPGFVENSAWAGVPIVTRRIGTDTLQLSAAGYRPGTGFVVVTPGRALFDRLPVGVPFPLNAGQQLQMRLVVGASYSGPQLVLDSTTTLAITVAGEGVELRRESGGYVRSLTIPAGEARSEPVMLRALKPGRATITVSRLDYETFTYIVDVRESP